ncbi:MAG: nitroreductase family protein [Chloroflexota bacterium]
MDVYEAIEKRRTTRVFTGGVPEELLKKIILAGTRAPSAGNSQPWEFIIVAEPGMVDQIAEHKYQQNSKISPQRFGAGTTQEYVDARAMMQRKAYRNCSVVAVCHKKGQAESTWMCIENMALAATAEGLGIVPSTFWGKHQEEVEKLLAIPDGYKLATVMLIGVQEGFPNTKYPDITRRPDFSWLHRNRFGVSP